MNQTPVYLTDHRESVLAYISSAQRDFLQDLHQALRGRPFWGTLEVKVQHGELVGSKVLQETRAYG